MGQFSNSGRTAVWGYIRTAFDPMTGRGAQYVHHLRSLAQSWSQKTQIRVTIVGAASDSADVISRVFKLFPIMAAVTLALVLVLCGLFFRSVLIPVWQCLTICMTLSFAYSLAVLTYQDGGLSWTGLPSLSGNLGAMPWLCPVMAFPFVVGICLDYDVFLLSRVSELRAQNLPPIDAIKEGVRSTGGIITVAGIIMAGTFLSMLLSGILFLNCGAFLMIIAVLYDTFFVRIAVVPAAMSLSGRLQWWPSDLSAVVVSTSGAARGRLPASLRARRHGALAMAATSPEKAAVKEEELYLLASDAPFFRAVTQAAISRLIECVNAVERGDWGRPVAGSEQDGLIYSHRFEGHSTTMFLGVLLLPDSLVTFDRIKQAMTPDAMGGFLANTAAPNVSQSILTFESATQAGDASEACLSLLKADCHRGCMGLELDRLSLSIYSELAPVQHDQGNAFANMVVGSNSSEMAKELARSAPDGLAERLAKQEAALAGSYGTMLVNHLTGAFVVKASDHWRLSLGIQLDPTVPRFLPRFGIELAQQEMVQDCLRGAYLAITQQSPSDG